LWGTTDPETLPYDLLRLKTGFDVTGLRQVGCNVATFVNVQLAERISSKSQRKNIFDGKYMVKDPTKHADEHAMTLPHLSIWNRCSDTLTNLAFLEKEQMVKATDATPDALVDYTNSVEAPVHTGHR
jgi:hypothetical protein